MSPDPEIQPALTDDALLLRIAGGAEDALGALYDRFAARAMAVALRILKSRTEAEDVLQEAFVEVWRGTGSFDRSRGCVSTWVLGIARNRSIDRLRARVARREREAAVGEAAAERPGTPSPPESAAAAEEQRMARDALATLPADQRTALELAYFEGLSQSEIAERTGAPLGTVKTRVRLGLEKLRSVIGIRDGDER